MATSGGQFSRLATLSHLLYDREVLELRGENESLKKDLLWKEHCVRKLRAALDGCRTPPQMPASESELRKVRNLIVYFDQVLSEA
jgi:hypothetical protein